MCFFLECLVNKLRVSAGALFLVYSAVEALTRDQVFASVKAFMKCVELLLERDGLKMEMAICSMVSS